jgi:hypothetical protein
MDSLAAREQILCRIHSVHNTFEPPNQIFIIIYRLFALPAIKVASYKNFSMLGSLATHPRSANEPYGIGADTSLELRLSLPLESTAVVT